MLYGAYDDLRHAARMAAAGANWWTPRGSGDARTIQTENGLEVLDPTALHAQGVVLRDAWGGIWAPL